jgi:hypothetical protein
VSRWSQWKRIARRLVWSRPSLYFPFRLLRDRDCVWDSNFELYIFGYPRSGNTFTARAFLSANPGAALLSHRHFPAFVIRAMKQNIPGMVLIRNPLDAAVSWSIFNGNSLRETLAYYTDYYSVLRRYREELFFVSFEEVISDMGKVITTFNSRWNTDYRPFEHTPENVACCMEAIEAGFRDSVGRIVESKVPRPSTQRESQKKILLQQVNHSWLLQKELHRANELYQFFGP